MGSQPLQFQHAAHDDIGNFQCSLPLRSSTLSRAGRFSGKTYDYVYRRQALQIGEVSNARQIFQFAVKAIKRICFIAGSEMINIQRVTLTSLSRALQSSHDTAALGRIDRQDAHSIQKPRRVSFNSTKDPI